MHERARTQACTRTIHHLCSSQQALPGRGGQPMEVACNTIVSPPFLSLIEHMLQPPAARAQPLMLAKHLFAAPSSPPQAHLQCPPGRKQGMLESSRASASATDGKRPVDSLNPTRRTDPEQRTPNQTQGRGSEVLHHHRCVGWERGFVGGVGCVGEPIPLLTPCLCRTSPLAPRPS